jgi:hypothetical protein
MNSSSNTQSILGVFLYINDSRIYELIKTIHTLAPSLHKHIIYQDLTNKPRDQYPNIVKQTRQLPIFIVKGINEPLVGILNIQKWLSSQVTRLNSQQNEQQGQNNSANGSAIPKIFTKDSADELDGFLPGEMYGSSSNYSYLSEKMNIDMNCNFERLVGMKGNFNDMKESVLNETKTNKNSDTEKRYDDMMKERKKLLESQNNGNIINL